ncbi:MAG: IS200/IS605 family transposase [Phycisphaeraceae bacterium]|nr:IS200/IS605 family transposase [Phycisphaeraceae bacterium]
MASTLTKLLIHVTFSTKSRQPTITSEIGPDLYAYTGGICRTKKCVLLAMGGTADHVHMFVNLAKTVALSDLMLEVKRETSRWMHRTTPAFQWQDGYFGFSLGESGAQALHQYIATQIDHHAKVDFKDEIRALCAKYGVKIDERYAWD